jgi:hypothetical protein
VTRGRHHAISIILDGMLITSARRQTACRPLFARCFAAVATGLILTGSISRRRLGYCDCCGTWAGHIQARGATL